PALLPDPRSFAGGFLEAGKTELAPTESEIVPALAIYRGTEPAPPRVVMKLCEIIGRCAGIERTISEIYESFAERWPQPPFGPLWRDLSGEELGHGKLLDSAALLPAAQREEASVEGPKLEAIRAQVLSRLPKPETTLEQAFDIALDLEELE